MKKSSFYVVLLACWVQSSYGAKLEERINLFGVVKPQKMSTSVSIGQGLVSKILVRAGDEVKQGTVLLQVFERETVRDYRSSLAGAVAKIHITEGAAASAGMPLVTVVDPEKKYFEYQLSPEQASKISLRSKIMNEKNESLAEIDRISPIVDPESGAVLASSTLLTTQAYRVGEIVPTVITLGEKDCDVVKDIAETGMSLKDYSILFVDKDKACLKKK